MSSLTPRILCLLVVAFAGLPAAARAAEYVPDFEEQTIVSGLTQPTTAVWSTDGRMFVAEKPGRVKVVMPGSETATEIYNFEDQVNAYEDRGLIGLALDSNFDLNHYMYLLYVAEIEPLTPDQDGQMASRLLRVQVDNSNFVSDPKVILGTEDGCVMDAVLPGPSWTSANNLDCIPAEGRSHAIGTVISAPDGTLYIGSGDASSYAEYDSLAYRTYDEQSLAGKIAHVDRNGNGLPGHAFCPADADLTHVCTKLHAKGFRNPFRFKLRGDGDLNVGDVGWAEREELNVIRTAGRSYGWPCYEGTFRTEVYEDGVDSGGKSLCGPEYAKEGTPLAHVAPNYDYNHSATNAVLGGPSYAGGPYPDSFDGSIFFGDYAAGFLKRLELDGSDGSPVVHDVATNWVGVDLMLTPDGEVAYADMGGFGPGEGSIKRIVYSPSIGTPRAVAKAAPIVGAKPLKVQLTGSGSSDPDGDPLTYDWDFGDGSPHSADANPAHSFSEAGVYEVTLTVDDGHGHTDSDTVEVSVFESPPTPTILAPTAGATYRNGDTIQLKGSATDAEDPSNVLKLTWSVILHHGAHAHALGTFTGATASFAAPTDHDADSYFEIRLRAEDSSGEWSQKTVEIHPQSVPLALRSVPAGAPVSYGGLPRTTPFTTSSAIGLKTTISAAARFSASGRHWFFRRWSDGGARLHQLEVTAAPVNLTAFYSEDTAFDHDASASSVQDLSGTDDPAFTADKAADDDPNTRWSSEKSDSEWWQVDLGAARFIDAVELDWEAAFASQYLIQTSLDGVSWSTAANVSLATPGLERTEFTGRKARYVRLQSVKRATTFGISIYEARVLSGTEPVVIVDPIPGGPPDPPPPPPPSYAELVRGTSGLLGYWPFGAKGRRFDGRDDFIKLPAAKIGKPRKVTVELLVKPATTKAKRVQILATNSRSALDDGFTFALDGRRRPVFSVGRSTRQRRAATGRRLTAGRVHHLVGTYDGRAVRVYVDGSLRAKRAYRGGIRYLTGRKLLLGRPSLVVPGSPGHFKGVLDDVAFYDRALTPSSIARHFRALP